MVHVAFCSSSMSPDNIPCCASVAAGRAWSTREHARGWGAWKWGHPWGRSVVHLIVVNPIQKLLVWSFLYMYEICYFMIFMLCPFEDGNGFKTSSSCHMVSRRWLPSPFRSWSPTTVGHLRSWREKVWRSKASTATRARSWWCHGVTDPQKCVHYQNRRCVNMWLVRIGVVMGGGSLPGSFDEFLELGLDNMENIK